MTDEEITGFNDRVTEKLGKENAALIADEIGVLITKNADAQKRHQELQEQFDRVKETNEKLVAANANLIHQIPMSEAPAPENKPPEPKAFDYRSIFGTNGKLK